MCKCRGSLAHTVSEVGGHIHRLTWFKEVFNKCCSFTYMSSIWLKSLKFKHRMYEWIIWHPRTPLCTRVTLSWIIIFSNNCTGDFAFILNTESMYTVIQRVNMCIDVLLTSFPKVSGYFCSWGNVTKQYLFVDVSLQ